MGVLLRRCMKAAKEARARRGAGGGVPRVMLLSLGAFMHLRNSTPTLFSLTHFARRERRQPTISEALLWAQLRGRKLGVRFRRQHPFALGYVVDFFAASARLVVEVDGGVHRREGHAERDAVRQRELEEEYGVRFLRVSAELVERDVLRAVELTREALARA